MVNMKKKAKISLYYLLFLSVISILIMYLVFAELSVKPASFSVNEDTSNLFNITVNSTGDPDGSDGSINFTRVNMTFPSTFTIDSSTNGTNSAGLNLTITGTTLSWINESGGVVVFNGTANGKYFWVKATQLIPSSYNINITTVDSRGRLNSTLVSVTINDITKPEVTVVYPISGRNYSLSSIGFNLSVSDNVNVSGCNYSLSPGGLKGYPMSNTSVSLYNATNVSIAEGNYLATFYCNDTSQNINSTTTINFTLDTTKPAITLISPANATTITSAPYSFTYNVTDVYALTCSYIIDDVATNTNSTVSYAGLTNTYATTLTEGVHYWNINCTDPAGNLNTSLVRTFTYTPPAASTTSTGGSSSTTIAWTSTQQLSNDQFTTGYTKELGTKNRLSFTIGSATHYAGIQSLTSTTATITIASTPKDVVFNIGDEKKFDVTNDSYYDLSVKLNSIANSKASITIKSIHELITAATPGTTETTTTDEEASAGVEEETSAEVEANLLKNKLFWIIIVLIIIIAAALIYNIYKKKR